MRIVFSRRLAQKGRIEIGQQFKRVEDSRASIYSFHFLDFMLKSQWWW
jgi:hypothetical protein